MDKPELDTSELIMIKDILEGVIETSSAFDADYADYADVDMMQFYLDRAKLLEKLKEVLKYRLIFNKVPPNL